jgi:hypothetical protein
MGIQTLQDAVAYNAGTLTGSSILAHNTVIVWFAPVDSYDGTVNFEVSVDGTTFFPALATNLSTGAAATTVASPASDVLYAVAVPAQCQLRARMSGGTQGSLSVSAIATTYDFSSTSSGTSAVTVANGADVAMGSTTDAGVSTDANGTVSAKLRGLIILLVNFLSRFPASLGQKAMTASLPVVIASDQSALALNKIQGAANVAVAQLATSTSAATLVAARATRRGVTIRNHDTSISVYVGPATVTASNGLLLKAGESVYVTWVGLIQVIAASGTPTVGTWDEWD